MPFESLLNPVASKAIALLGSQLIASNWYPARGTTRTTQQPPEAYGSGSTLLVGRNTTITQLACNVTTAGSAGALVRLGIYRISPGTYTANLIADGGTVDATTTGVKTVTVAAAVRTGDLLWLCAVVQGAATTRPTLTAQTGADPALGVTNSSTVFSALLNGYSKPSISAGALPASADLATTATTLMVAALAG